MQGLSEICQNPRCGRPAVYCCDRCMKRTYCSRECQVLDWKNHKNVCTLNENQKEIKESMERLREKYGSVFRAPKQAKKRPKNSDTSDSVKKSKKTKTKREAEVEYNGALLPYCLETINDDIIEFLTMLGMFPSHFEITSRDDQYKTLSDEMMSRLYHTSSISETVEVVQSLCDELMSKEPGKIADSISVVESPHHLHQLVILLSSRFGFTSLHDKFEKQTLYSPANDYKVQSDERRFCTHCGDKEGLVDHPALRYVYLCKSCLKEYEKNKWEQEEEHDIDCRCCGDGGNVVLCDFCSHSICSNCIMLHMGAEEWERSQSETKWSCMMCKKDDKGNLIFAKD